MHALDHSDGRGQRSDDSEEEEEVLPWMVNAKRREEEERQEQLRAAQQQQVIMIARPFNFYFRDFLLLPISATQPCSRTCRMGVRGLP